MTPVDSPFGMKSSTAVVGGDNKVEKEKEEARGVKSKAPVKAGKG